MLIVPIFDERVWLNAIRGDLHDKVRITHTDTLFSLEMLFADQWVPAAGFERIIDGVYWTDINPHIYLQDCYGHKLIEYLHEYKQHYGFDLDALPEAMEYFGVADSPEQLLEYPQFVEQFIDPVDEHYILCCTPYHERWDLNTFGKYIGNQENLTEVIRFKVFMIINEQTGCNFII